MKFFIFVTTFLIALYSQAQLVLNPAPSSGQIALTQANTYIYISNTSPSSQTLSLSLVGSGITMASNRCTTVKANSSCYIIVAVSNYTTNSSALSVDLKNGSTTLATLTVTPVAPPSSSLFSVSSLAVDGFSNYSFVIQNKTPSVKSYNPVFSGTDASKYSIVLNRCNNVASSGTCQVVIKLAPQLAGSYSATITEPQVTGSISISSTITSSTIGVIQPPNPSITLNPASDSFGTITNLGKTASKIFTITNNGNVAVSPIVSVSGSGLEIALNRCLILLSPNQSCTVSVLFNAVSSMTNGAQSGLSISAQATSSTTLLSSSLSATLNVNPVLLSSSGGSTGGGTPLLINSANGNMFHYSAINNKLYAWGAGSYGLVGDGTQSDVGEAYSLLDNSPLVGKSLKDFSFFDSHACLLTTTNEIFCWGYNSGGAVSPIIDGSTIASPLQVTNTGDMGSKTIKKLAVGAYMTAALSEDGHIYFWGGNGSGQSGSGINTVSPSPADLAYCGYPYGGSVDCQYIVVPKEIYMGGAAAGQTFKDVFASYSNVCGLTTTNRLFCWGGNYSGNVGDGSFLDKNVPTEIDMTGALAGKTIKKFYMSYGPSCVLTTEDLLYCWGDNYFGQSGVGSFDSSIGSPQPVVMSGPLAGKTVKDVFLGYASACLIASDDKPYCWGWNSVGQLGGSPSYNEISPYPVDMTGALAGKTVKTMSLPYYSGNTVCAIASDDKPYCWGSNQAGQLGDGTTNDSSFPVAVDPTGILAGKTVTKIASHGGSVCVIAHDTPNSDQVYCIGANYNGQLGNGNANIGNSSSVWVLAPTIPVL